MLRACYEETAPVEFRLNAASSRSVYSRRDVPYIIYCSFSDPTSGKEPHIHCPCASCRRFEQLSRSVDIIHPSTIVCIACCSKSSMIYSDAKQTNYSLPNNQFTPPDTTQLDGRVATRTRFWADACTLKSKKNMQRRYSWIEQGLTSHQTHYRSYWGRVLRVKRPNQQCHSTEGRES